METVIRITLAVLAILGIGGLIVAGVVWASRRAMQRQATEMATQAGEGDGPDQQATAGGGGPTKPVPPK